MLSLSPWQSSPGLSRTSRNALANGLNRIFSDVISSFWYAVTAMNWVSWKLVSATLSFMFPFSLNMTMRGSYLCNELSCIWPLLGGLLVSLTLLNEMESFIQCDPKLGESGCLYSQRSCTGSGLVPCCHSPFMYFHLWLSICWKSTMIS